MSIKDTIREHMNPARKNNDALSKRVYSMALDAIMKAEKNAMHDFTDEEIVVILNKEIKQYNETLEFAVKANNFSLIQEIQSSIEMLKAFVPEMMSEEEIKAYLHKVLEDIQPVKSNKGKIMKSMSALKGKADMKLISKIVDGAIN